METPLTPRTIIVTPEHLKDGWALVQEYSLSTGDLLTVSIMTDEQADRLPPETATSEFLVKPLGNVLAREAAGCFAHGNRRATVTFNTNGRVQAVATIDEPPRRASVPAHTRSDDMTRTQTPDDTLTQTLNDLMLDIRTATGDATYSLECWVECDDDPQMQLFVGVTGRWTTVSPRLSPAAMAAYLAAFSDGVHAGYVAAKRGR